MFGFGKPKRDGKTILANLIRHGAGSISEKEGKSQSDGEYLAICALVEDLTSKKNKAGYQDLMAVIQQQYPQHFNDVITYVGWTTGVLKLKPEAEAQLTARHS